MFCKWSILRKIMVNLEGSGNPPKYSPCPSLSFCLGLHFRVRLILFGGDENANALDYTVPFVGNLRRNLV
jgi:hypothetical protein